MMELRVNGEARRLPDGLTVAQLLETLQIVPERVVVEVNLAILKRAQQGSTVLKDGDQVEIVHFVGGGSGRRTQDAGHRTQRVRTHTMRLASCVLHPTQSSNLTHG
jgi:thiamine biosynthesis protein ThiS